MYVYMYMYMMCVYVGMYAGMIRQNLCGCLFQCACIQQDQSEEPAGCPAVRLSGWAGLGLLVLISVSIIIIIMIILVSLLLLLFVLLLLYHYLLVLILLLRNCTSGWLCKPARLATQMRPAGPPADDNHAYIYIYVCVYVYV